MTGAPLVDWIIGAVAAVAGIFGVFAGGRKALADARSLKTPATPYEALANRVTKLEESDAEKSVELSVLRAQVRRLAGVLTREVHTLITWHESGSKPPPPDREVTVIKDVIHELADK